MTLKRERAKRSTRTAPPRLAARAVEKSTFLLRNIDPHLWRQLKAKAALRGLTIREAVEEMIVEWVAK